ncbi:hypothetical protein E2562_004724 [Oryza meyeriana var. granulata]|uniref:Phytocyanin domain-containing protein n=1 Tax=Oryza meyeriana var. granulata TaxID=110450 RepID=A0A6G1DDP8_9ORYZ|nr:hypothetical protein E2562_004724 [Oryza meyeriana var. granulata]
MAAKAASLSSTAPAAALLLLLAAAGLAGATEYTVGDSEGWTIGPSYLAWSQKYNFTAGDTLVFNYVQRQHDVFRVTQDAFQTCDPANKTMQRWASGHDVVELAAPGIYYFICNVSGHCLGGMKFSVAVGEPLPPPSPPPPPPRASLFPPPPPVGSGAASLTRRRWMQALVMPVSCLGLIIGMLI